MSPLDCKEIKPVNPKGNRPWIFIGSTDAEAKAPICWPPDVKSQLIGKDPDVGKDWRQEEKGITEDEMVGWYHRLTGHEFEQTLGDGEGQGSQHVLQCTGLQRVRHDSVTEQQQRSMRTALRRCTDLNDVQCSYFLSLYTLATFTQKTPNSPKWCSYLEFHHGENRVTHIQSLVYTDSAVWLG